MLSLMFLISSALAAETQRTMSPSHRVTLDLSKPAVNLWHDIELHWIGGRSFQRKRNGLLRSDSCEGIGFSVFIRES